MDGFGRIICKIETLLEDRGISKNTVCRDLDIPRSNFNRYCKNEFQRIDTRLFCKLCHYFECELGELLEYVDEE